MEYMFNVYRAVGILGPSKEESEFHMNTLLDTLPQRPLVRNKVICCCQWFKKIVEA